MQFLHSEVEVPNGSYVRVDLGAAANVRVMDWSNFCSYKSGQAHHFYGGHYRQTPAIIRPPSSGRWYIAIDLGGYGGRISANVRVI